MNREEQRIHIALVQHLRHRAVGGLVYWHSPQGAHYAGVRQGELFKAMGVRAGVSDLILLHRGQLYALELKKLKGGRVSAEQRQFLNDVRAAGGLATECNGLDKALAQLEKWGLIRGATEFALDLFVDSPAAKPWKPHPLMGYEALMTTEQVATDMAAKVSGPQDIVPLSSPKRRRKVANRSQRKAPLDGGA